MPPKKIVIIGPESTGKSTLCQGLADHFHTDWVREYARGYLEVHGMDYLQKDLLTIAKGQLALEDEATGTQPILFIDTDMYVMKVWSEFVFGACDPWILEQIVSRRYDGYLLCRTDLPWTFDVLREYPDEGSREKLFHIYRDLLINQSTPWAEIGGQSDERLQAAINAVTEMLTTPSL